MVIENVPLFLFPKSLKQKLFNDNGFNESDFWIKDVPFSKKKSNVHQVIFKALLRICLALGNQKNPFCFVDNARLKGHFHSLNGGQNDHCGSQWYGSSNE